MIFGMADRLIKLRKSNNLTQEQVAARLHMSKGAISTYELGASQPPVDILVKLALIYKTTTDYILGLDKHEVIVVDNLNPELIQILQSIIDLFHQKVSK